jgi:hypothetical protein
MSGRCGFRGVSSQSKAGRVTSYKAALWIPKTAARDGYNKVVGSCPTEEEAARAYDSQRVSEFGEAGRQGCNFPNDIDLSLVKPDLPARKPPPSPSRVLEIIKDAVATEQRIASEELPAEQLLIDTSSQQVCEHIEFCADRLLEALGCPKHYLTANPTYADEAMRLLLQGKTNFFEKLECAVAGAIGDEQLEEVEVRIQTQQKLDMCVRMSATAQCLPHRSALLLPGSSTCFVVDGLRQTSAGLPGVAEAAGVRLDDVILAVNGQETDICDGQVLRMAELMRTDHSGALDVERTVVLRMLRRRRHTPMPVMKVAGNAWRNLSAEARAPYVAQSEADHARHEAAMPNCIPVNGASGAAATAVASSSDVGSGASGAAATAVASGSNVGNGASGAAATAAVSSSDDDSGARSHSVSTAAAMAGLRVRYKLPSERWVTGRITSQYRKRNPSRTWFNVQLDSATAPSAVLEFQPKNYGAVWVYEDLEDGGRFSDERWCTPSEGARIEIFWPDDAKWYPATVGAPNALCDELRDVLYDDGVVESLCLSQERWREIGTSLRRQRSGGGAEAPASKRAKLAQHKCALTEHELRHVRSVPPLELSAPVGIVLGGVHQGFHNGMPCHVGAVRNVFASPAELHRSDSCDDGQLCRVRRKVLQKFSNLDELMNACL